MLTTKKKFIYLKNKNNFLNALIQDTISFSKGEYQNYSFMRNIKINTHIGCHYKYTKN